MIKFSYSNNNVSVIDFNEDNVVDLLRPAVYQICFSEFSGYYLEKIKDNFDIKEKQIFGKTLEQFHKINITYNERETSTGVLLTGTKGSGKTLLAEFTCNEMLKQGIPTVIINDCFEGPDFCKFVSDLGDCVIFIDEFAKVYSNPNNSSNRDSNNDPQASLLTILNGVYSNKRLVILTENNSRDINEFMLGRTGRIYYHWKFTRLDKDTIKQYCESNDVEESVISEIMEISNLCEEFTFDILKAIIEEYKRFNEPVEQLVKDLNIELLSSANKTKLKIVKVINSTTKEEVEVREGSEFVSVDMDIYSRHAYFSVYPAIKNTGSTIDAPVSASTVPDNKYSEVYVNSRDIVYKSDTGIIFESEDDNILVFTEVVEESSDPIDYRAF